MKNSLFLVLLPLLFTACATPYQASGALGGYSEKKIADNKYELQFLGNKYTDMNVIHEFWSRRASELCNGKPYNGKSTSGQLEKSAGMLAPNGVFLPMEFSYPLAKGTVECLTD